MTTKFIIRNDDNPKIIHNDLADYLDVESILKKDYEYIYESILNEGFILENKLGDVFKEILFENKVVGFAFYELNSQTNFVLNEIYILPEFRGNSLFLLEINILLAAGNSLSILQPTKNLVERRSAAVKEAKAVIKASIERFLDAHPDVKFKKGVEDAVEQVRSAVSETIDVAKKAMEEPTK